jgi:fatty-acyl-CoA synthase
MSLRPGRPEIENWADTRVSRIGAEACPGAKPVRLALAPTEAQARVRQVLKAEGLAVGGEAPGSVEATWESFWYGFKDDVIVRIRPEEAGSRIDLRSVSRVGMSDLGANCERVTALAAALSG